MTKTNEFGEEITQDELLNYSKKIRKLSDEQIDNLWHACGFIIASKEKGQKAIRKSDIEKIRKDHTSASEVLWHLLAETKLNDFKKELSELEKNLQ